MLADQASWWEDHNALPLHKRLAIIRSWKRDIQPFRTSPLQLRTTMEAILTKYKGEQRLIYQAGRAFLRDLLGGECAVPCCRLQHGQQYGKFPAEKTAWLQGHHIEDQNMQNYVGHFKLHYRNVQAAVQSFMNFMPTLDCIILVCEDCHRRLHNSNNGNKRHVHRSVKKSADAQGGKRKRKILGW